GSHKTVLGKAEDNNSKTGQ
ncbi:hypothetical protein CCACVL1_30333, partial [Corchorus capsularis]